MKRVLALLFALVLVVSFVGCNQTKTKSHRLDNIARVFMNEPRIYTFLVRDSIGLTVVVLHERRNEYEHYNVQFVQDADPKSPMTAEWRGVTTDSCLYDDLTIHIHSPIEIEGGGWDYGKFGHGTTQVVQ